MKIENQSTQMSDSLFVSLSGLAIEASARDDSETAQKIVKILIEERPDRIFNKRKAYGKELGGEKNE